MLHGLALRGAYLRWYAPLAGMYPRFGDPNSLGGSVYQWNASNPSGRFNLRARQFAAALRRPLLVDFTVASSALCG